jgi:C1A family cysteine protease
MTRVYNRKVPVPLPLHRMISKAILGLPSAYDGRQFCGAVKDQGSEGSCTAHTGTSAAEWIFRAYFGKMTRFAPQYTYARELMAQGSFPQDVGSDGVTLCNSMIVNGLCEEAAFPYIAGQITAPTPEQDANAALHRLGAYHGLTGSSVALSALGNATPWPVEVGFTVYSSFESELLASTGVMPVPAAGESVLGGHEVLMVGYDISVAPTLRPASCPPAALIQNSWGTTWGLNGFFWMPLAILDATDTDLKVAHSGAPWK